MRMCDLRLLERTQAPRLRTWATRVQFLALPTAQTQLVLGLSLAAVERPRSRLGAVSVARWAFAK